MRLWEDVHERERLPAGSSSSAASHSRKYRVMERELGGSRRLRAAQSGLGAGRECVVSKLRAGEHGSGTVSCFPLGACEHLRCVIPRRYKPNNGRGHKRTRE